MFVEPDWNRRCDYYRRKWCVSLPNPMIPNGEKNWIFTGQFLTIKHRATLQPSVPAPKSKHRVFSKISKSISGAKRHFINFKFNPTAVSARWTGFIEELKLTWRDPRRCRSFFSQPVDCGTVSKHTQVSHRTFGIHSPPAWRIDSIFNWRYKEWWTYRCPSRNRSRQQIRFNCSTEFLKEQSSKNSSHDIPLTDDNKVMSGNFVLAIRDVLNPYLDHWRQKHIPTRFHDEEKSTISSNSLTTVSGWLFNCCTAATRLSKANDPFFCWRRQQACDWLASKIFVIAVI